MDRTNPTSSLDPSMNQVQTPAIEGYFSGMGADHGRDDGGGSHSDESLLHRVIVSTVTLASRSFEYVGRRRLGRRHGRNTLGNSRGYYATSFDRIREEPFHSPNGGNPGNYARRNMDNSHYRGYLASTGAADDDTDWRSSTAQSSHGVEETHFLEQVRRFPKLPLYIHKQINKSFGNTILNHFDVTLVRVQNGHIVGSTESIAVFVTNPDTSRCWLSGFMKHCLREATDSGLRFNRLVTPELIYNVVGPTAVEVDSSKSNARPIKFVFDFGNAEAAAEFVQLVKELKNFIEETQHQRSANELIGKSKNSLLSSALSSLSEGTQAHRAESLASHPRSHNVGTPAKRGRILVRFARENTLVFSQSNRKDFEQLGQGTLTIVETGGAFNKLALIVADGPHFITLMEHKIYKWNEICIKPLNNAFACFWTGCAELHGRKGLPKFYAFKLIVDSEDEASSFYNAFKTSVANAEKVGLSPASYLRCP